MSNRRRRWNWSAFAATVPIAFAPQAHANTEPAAAYDARSVALGGTGSAYIHNGASIYHNPAAMDGIDKLAITGVLSLSKPETTVPLNGPDTAVSSDASPFPLFLVGGAYRVLEPLVVGFAVFPTAGFGSVYHDVQTPAGPVDLEQMVMIVEATPSASLRLTEGLAIGVGYRITYMTQSAEQIAPLPGPPGVPPQLGEVKVDLSGTSFKGAHIGLFAQPFENTRIGLTYRNKFTNHLEGTVTMAGQEMDAETKIAVPHSFRLGAAQHLLDRSLLLVGEVKRSLYAESNKEIVTTMQTPMGPQDMVIKLDWENVWTAGFGAEYTLPSTLAFRAGYSLSESATPEQRASYYLPPPALLHTLHAGAGIKLESFEVDVGGFYSFGGKEVTPLQDGPDAANPGEYKTTFLDATVSVTYRM